MREIKLSKKEIKNIVLERVMKHAREQTTKILNAKKGFIIGDTVTITLHLTLAP